MLFIPLLAFLFLLLYVIYPLMLSPLRKIPRPNFSGTVSSLWILGHRARGTENNAVWDAHRRLGPILQLGPNEVSVATLRGSCKDLMERPFEKSAWYLRFCNYHGYASSRQASALP